MTNKEVATIFNDLGKIMELHGENKFKVRSYSNAYIQLRKVDGILFDMEPEEIGAIKGVGKAISEKIQELKSTGTIQTYEQYLADTPPGVVKMLRIKGFGPKKIGVIWKEMEIETLGELLYACNENRLIELKGFGEKTQAELKKSIEYFLQSEHKFRYADVAHDADELLSKLQTATGAKVSSTSALHTMENEIELLSYIIEGTDHKLEITELQIDNVSSALIQGTYREIYPVEVHCSDDYERDLFVKTYSESLRSLGDSAAMVQSKLGLFDELIPEMKSLATAHFELMPKLGTDLIIQDDIKGVVHSHSTYSDGIHTLQEMAEGAKSKGFEYLVISDHSKSAFYAGGLKEQDLERQWEEIDQLNKEIEDFHIFKSIESDILTDGSLDYDEDVLAQFDMVIGSIHSNLKMDINKATNRLLKAIENPYTTMLGHPTGRLILSRQGYPIDHQRIIDACAANDVSIEVNANPFRLDIDWEWLPYAMNKEVMISINPDAHSINGIDHIKWGVISARKGGLMKQFCLNAMNLENFNSFLQTRKG